MGSRAQRSRLGVTVVRGFPAGRPGASCPAALVLSSAVFSTVESAGEESGIQLQVELLGNLS